jgi:demethylmenaquinone methyltransferase/2-methoxy-6-polyprenyl-1,4-benzoquinol methylase
MVLTRVMSPQTPQASSKTVASPIPAMPAYFSNDDEKRRFLTGIFDRTAPDYDRMERLLGLGSGSWYRRHALTRAGLAPGMSVIDVAVGTGLVAREAVTIVGAPDLVVGVDPSPGMLQSAKVPTGVHLVRGSAEEIPFPDASFDFLSMGYALRHISDLSVAFKEFHRVLKSGGRACILEITVPKSTFAKFMLKVYMRGVVPTLGRIFARSNATAELWRYYWDTIEVCVPSQDVVATLRSSGFRDVRRVVSYGIFSEYQAHKE